MQLKKILVLLAVFVALGGVAYFLQGPGRKDRARVKEKVFTNMDTGEVRKVVFRRPSGETVLVRGEGETWLLGEEKLPADGESIDRFLTNLKDLREEATASTNPEKKALFEVGESSGVAVLLENGEGEPLAEFIVGKGGADFVSGYLRLQGEDRVLLVSANLRSEVSREPVDWRDRKIVKIGRDEVGSIRIMKGEEEVLLEKDGDGEWLVDGRRADRESVEQYLGIVMNIRAVAFADPGENDQAGLDASREKVVIQGAGEAFSLIVGTVKEEANQRYVGIGAGETVYLVSRYAADSLLKTAADFPPPPEGESKDDDGDEGDDGEEEEEKSSAVGEDDDEDDNDDDEDE